MEVEARTPADSEAARRLHPAHLGGSPGAPDGAAGVVDAELRSEFLGSPHSTVAYVFIVMEIASMRANGASW